MQTHHSRLGLCKTVFSFSESKNFIWVNRFLLFQKVLGGSAFVYPEDIAGPLGGSDYSPYVMLRLQYENYGNEDGGVDNSGFKIWYSDELRENEAAITELGVQETDKMVIPPMQTAWPVSGYCTPDCTSVALPEKGITVFAGLFRTGRHVVRGRETFNQNQE